MARSMLSVVSPLALAASVALGQACASDDPPKMPLLLPEGCQPLIGTHACFLPFPSDFYREPDPSQRTGFRIVMRGAAKPKSYEGRDADVTAAWPGDGFSVHTSIVAHLPGELSSDGLPTLLDDATRSAQSTSTTILLEADAGKLVPHYTDLDPRARDDERRALVMHTFAPLKARTRYVVALQGVRTVAGPLAKPHEPFRRLRDGKTEREGALLPIAARFDREVFGVLEAAGVARAGLQLAWDFTTGSEEQPVEDMQRVRELTMAELASAPPLVTVTSVDPSDDPRILRTVRGTVRGPMFLANKEPGARLTRGPDGRVVRSGSVDFEFYASIPQAALSAAPARALAFGHGFFGSTAELDGKGARTIASTLGVVELAISWWGMSNDDRKPVADTIIDAPTQAPSFTDRVHQAMANWITMTAAIKGPLATQPAFERAPGTPLYDPSSIYFFGASQGHILGGTFAAVSPDIARFVLNVGGAGFAHLIPRAAPFSPFFLVIDGMTHDDLLTQALVAMLQRPLDRIDPASYAPFVLDKKWPGAPADRRVLLQIGLGDASVPNNGAFYHARELGLRVTAPTPLVPFALEPSPPEGLRSAMTLFDFGIDTRSSAKAVALSENQVHEGVRVNPAALRQMDAFLRPDSRVIHPCAGPCDPE